MEIRLFQDFEKLKGYQKSWNDLILQSNDYHPFSNFEWLYAWTEIFLKNDHLFILIARDNNKTVGIAPCYLKKTKLLGMFSIQQLRFLGDTFIGSDFLDFIIQDGYQKIVIENFFLFLIQHKIYHLHLDDINIDSKNLVYIELISQQLNGFLNISKKSTCPQIQLPESFNTFLNLPEKTFKKIILNRDKKKLKKNFNLHFVDLSELSSIDSLLNQWLKDHAETESALNNNEKNKYLSLDFTLTKLFDLHHERWINTNTQSLFTNTEIKTFYKKISPFLLQNDQLRVWALILNNQIEVIEFGIQTVDAYYSLQSGCSKLGLQHKAGNILSLFIFEKLIGSIQTFHYLRGSEPYKYQWGSQNHYTVTCIIQLDSKFQILFKIQTWIKKYRWKIKNFLKKNLQKIKFVYE